jgi:23S rRNA pseudouridine2604 synthase
MSEPIRLSKRLIELVGCSRREAELFIEGGWVRVDGEVIDEPQFKVDAQRVELDAGAKAVPPEPITLIAHQGVDQSREELQRALSPTTLSQAHSYGKRPLKGHFARLECPAELPEYVTGLQVFTQDFRISRKLGDDIAKLEQEFVVEISGDMAEHGLNRLNHGVTYKGKPLPAVKASWQNEKRLRIVMKNPVPGVLTQLCNSVGLGVVSVRRIRVGGVSMGKLAAGEWRYMAVTEKF